jgi:hypothetical protein
MMPGAADQYRFRAKTGEHLVIAVAARELMPYISDAVPGWFQAAVTLRDREGRELVSADHYLFHPDPLIEYDVPADGEYIAEIHDSIFRGREDFICRVSMGELPVITSVFPLGAKAGKRIPVETRGWNFARRTRNGKPQERPGSRTPYIAAPGRLHVEHGPICYRQIVGNYRQEWHRSAGKSTALGSRNWSVHTESRD